MTNLFQLRNKLSNRVLTPSQQINTKGKGRGKMEKDMTFDLAPALPIAPSTPTTTSSPANNGRGMIQRGNPGGPPQFGPGGGNSFTPTI